MKKDEIKYEEEKVIERIRYTMTTLLSVLIIMVNVIFSNYDMSDKVYEINGLLLFVLLIIFIVEFNINILNTNIGSFGMFIISVNYFFMCIFMFINNFLLGISVYDINEPLEALYLNVCDIFILYSKIVLSVIVIIYILRLFNIDIKSDIKDTIKMREEK